MVDCDGGARINGFSFHCQHKFMSKRKESIRSSGTPRNRQTGDQDRRR